MATNAAGFCLFLKTLSLIIPGLIFVTEPGDIGSSSVKMPQQSPELYLVVSGKKDPLHTRAMSRPNGTLPVPLIYHQAVLDLQMLSDRVAAPIEVKRL